MCYRVTALRRLCPPRPALRQSQLPNIEGAWAAILRSLRTRIFRVHLTALPIRVGFERVRSGQMLAACESEIRLTSDRKTHAARED